MTQTSWIPIKYRDFYDVPRLVVVEWREELYLLDSRFDDDLDEYADVFVVYRLPAAAKQVLDQESWAGLPSMGQQVGELSVNEVAFDATRRRAISDDLFRALGLAA